MSAIEPEPDPELRRVFWEAIEAASDDHGGWMPEDVVRELVRRGVRVGLAELIGDIVRPVADLWSTTDQHHWDGCHRNHPGCLAETILARLDGDQDGTP